MSDVVVIYRNLNDRLLHNGKWSVAAATRTGGKGKVIRHSDELVLQDVRFVVKENRRQAIVAGGHREVHAWAVGTIANAPELTEGVDITYRPHQCGSFIRRDNEQPVTSAAFVRFGRDGTAAAYGVHA